MELLDYKRFDSAEVGYHELGKYVSIIYFKDSKSEDLRAFWNYAFELKLKYNSNSWFLDRRLENVFPADMKWFFAEWLKKSAEITPLSNDNPRYAAMIMPQNFYSEFTTEEFIKEYSNKGIIAKIFKNYEDAHSWLMKSKSDSTK